MRLPSWLTRPSPLAWRIYVVGLLQFALVAALMEVNRRASQRPEPWERDTRYVAAGLENVWSDPDEVRREAQRAADAFTWKVEVRDPDGALVAHAEPRDAGPRFEPRSPRGSTPIVLRDGRTAHLDYVIGPRPNGPPPPGLPFGLGFPSLLVLVVVGLTSVVASRSLATPLANLAEVARRFGSGKLDARARMKRSDEIGDVAKAFDEMADRIANLLLAERELLANVSHELRTPLARIRVALDLANEADPQDKLESLGEIAQDLAELERIVDDVLASARLALGSGEMTDASLRLRSETVDVRELLERSIARLGAQHPTRPLEATIASELPPVSGDPVLLRRVVDNLLDNAHKYTEDPSAPISVEARKDGAEVLVEIRDRGIGIAEEDLPRLFEPFFRVDRSRTRATGGLGLGLALARRVVAAHEGTLEFESTLGEGTRARLRLPAR
ncbi:MAG: HAMP domain-containing histidine kinase [Deltaproteobacteria bacterium]|nr:HAMP domain-containing histidine kinase [Deltaproteobacteria bacterium]